MDKWSILFTVVISILCGIVANIGTPTITKLFTKGIKGYRSAQLNKHKIWLETILAHRNDYLIVILLLLKDIFAAGLFFFLSIWLLVLGYFWDVTFIKIVGLLPIGAAIGALISGYQYVKLILYPKYTDRLSRKIEKLEAKVPANKQDETQALSN